jgi:hypothetical protein
VDDARVPWTALVPREGLLRGRVDRQGVAAGVDGGTAGEQSDGLGRPAVVRKWAEVGVDDRTRTCGADLVSLSAVADPCEIVTVADEVIGALGVDRARDVGGRGVDDRECNSPFQPERR